MHRSETQRLIRFPKVKYQETFWFHSHGNSFRGAELEFAPLEPGRAWSSGRAPADSQGTDRVATEAPKPSNGDCSRILGPFYSLDFRVWDVATAEDKIRTARRLDLGSAFWRSRWLRSLASAPRIAMRVGALRLNPK